MANFDFTCPQCGVLIEVEESLRGLVLECPSCGKGVVVPPKPQLKPVAQQDKQEDLNAVAIRRRLAEQEAEEAAVLARKQARAAKIQRQQLVSMVVKFVFALVVVGAVACGVMAWRRHRAEQARLREEARLKAEEKEALANREREAEWQKRRDEAQQRQREAAAKRNEELKLAKAKQELAKERYERERAEQERINEEREKEWQKKIADEEAQAKEQKERVERYGRIEERFSKATVCLWKDMPKAERPGSAKGVCHCLVPLRDYYGLYEVETSTNGAMRVVKLSGEGEADVSVEMADYVALVAKYGCLCLSAAGDKVYASAPKGPEGAKYRLSSSTMTPSSLVWGDGLCWLIRRYGMGTQNLVYDVSFLPANGKAVPVGKFAFGQSLERSQIEEALVSVTLKSWRPPKAKTIRRTVEFYDGSTIKRGANGVTYVPRSPTGRIGSSYPRLYAEAQRQEEMLASMQSDTHEQARTRMREKVNSLMADGFVQVSPGISDEKVFLPE